MLDSVKTELNNIDLNIIAVYIWDNITFETFLKFIVIYFIIVYNFLHHAFYK